MNDHTKKTGTNWDCSRKTGMSLTTIIFMVLLLDNISTIKEQYSVMLSH